MNSTIAGYAADALKSLSPEQLAFIRQLPKAELHAHLNGCIPIKTLRELAQERLSNSRTLPAEIQPLIERLQDGVVLNEIHDFFGLFPAIYALTSSPQTLAVAAKAVLTSFLEPSDDNGGFPQAAYLELRSTPRETPEMSRMEYIKAVLNEVEKYPSERAALIVSLDRRMGEDVARECVNCAIELKKAGRRVVGVDLCGDPLAGNMEEFTTHYNLAKEAGLGVTLHIAETKENPVEDTLKLLSFNPDRLGHATFLDAAQKDFVRTSKIGVEICLSSNLLCKTAASLEEHHIGHYLKHNHPIAICTDDTLPFRNSLVGEYALLVANAPLGLALSNKDVERIAQMGMECRFKGV